MAFHLTPPTTCPQSQWICRIFQIRASICHPVPHIINNTPCKISSLTWMRQVIWLLNPLKWARMTSLDWYHRRGNLPRWTKLGRVTLGGCKSSKFRTHSSKIERMKIASADQNFRRRKRTRQCFRSKWQPKNNRYTASRINCLKESIKISPLLPTKNPMHRCTPINTLNFRILLKEKLRRMKSRMCLGNFQVQPTSPNPTNQLKWQAIIQSSWHKTYTAESLKSKWSRISKGKRQQRLIMRNMKRLTVKIWHSIWGYSSLSRSLESKLTQMCKAEFNPLLAQVSQLDLLLLPKTLNLNKISLVKIRPCVKEPTSLAGLNTTRIQRIPLK